MNELSGGDGDAIDGNAFAPARRAVRGQALRRYAETTWPTVYGDMDQLRSAEQVLNDVVHLIVADVSIAKLPDAVGELLGRIAADVAVDRAVEAGDLLRPEEVERMIGRLRRSVRERHYGDGDDW